MNSFLYQYKMKVNALKKDVFKKLEWFIQLFKKHYVHHFSHVVPWNPLQSLHADASLGNIARWLRA